MATGADPSALSRHESEAQRIDRNWSELLQELRVIQTGFQILTAFLISLPFQSGFPRLSGGQKLWYGATVVVAMVATVVQLAPVVTHRVVFRLHEKDHLLKLANTEAKAGLGLLGLTLLGSLGLVLWVVFGLIPMVVAMVGVAVVIGVLWIVLPAVMRFGGAGTYD